MAKQRIVLSGPDLQSYSAEHIWYEIRMFFGTGSVLPGGICSPQLDFVDDAVLESFLLHLRNLLNFFYPERIMPGDVIAADYFDSGAMPSHLKSKLLSEAKVRADTELSHLTTKRLAGHHPDKSWKSAPLMHDMATVIEAFITTASAQKLDSDFVVRVKGKIAPFRTTASLLLKRMTGGFSGLRNARRSTGDKHTVRDAAPCRPRRPPSSYT